MGRRVAVLVIFNCYVSHLWFPWIVWKHSLAGCSQIFPQYISHSYILRESLPTKCLLDQVRNALTWDPHLAHGPDQVFFATNKHWKERLSSVWQLLWHRAASRVVPYQKWTRYQFTVSPKFKEMQIAISEWSLLSLSLGLTWEDILPCFCHNRTPSKNPFLFPTYPNLHVIG